MSEDTSETGKESQTWDDEFYRQLGLEPNEKNVGVAKLAIRHLMDPKDTFGEQLAKVTMLAQTEGWKVADVAEACNQLETELGDKLRVAGKSYVAFEKVDVV